VASSSKYLWILSRSPQLDKKTTEMLVKEADSLGFDVEKLYFTPQD
jgi:lipocalin